MLFFKVADSCSFHWLDVPLVDGYLGGFRFGAFVNKATMNILLSVSFDWPIDSSVGKESACSAGDPGSTPWSGRSAGEEIGYPLLYSWASLVVQLVKNLPTMRETWVQSLGWEDPLKKGKATHSNILAWRVQSMESQRVSHDWAIFTFTFMDISWISVDRQVYIILH